jgi:hypothetical protein
VLLPLLPPQTVYALCMILSWWAMTRVMACFCPKDFSGLTF